MQLQDGDSLAGVPSGSALTIREVDGSPSLTPTVLEVPNGSLEDRGGGVARLNVSGSGAALMARTAWVSVASGNDGTGVLGDSGKPYATIDAALTAGAAGAGGPLTVVLGRERYAPITGSLLNASALSEVELRGAGEPQVDDPTNPATLVGGTIIDGPLMANRPNLRVYDLGVDSGSAVCAARYGGTAQEGLLASTNPTHSTTAAPNPGIRLDRVVGLVKSAPVHGVLVENVTRAWVGRVRAWGGEHGVVLKGVYSRIERVEAWGQSGEALIIKSNAYAACHDNSVGSVFAGAVGSTGAGVSFEAEDGTTLDRIHVGLVQCVGTSYDVRTRPIGSGDHVQNIVANVLEQGFGVHHSQLGSGARGTLILTGLLGTPPALFQDTFSGGSVLDSSKWTVPVGSWTVSGGTAHGGGGEAKAVATTALPSGDWAAQVDVSRPSDISGGLMLGYVDPSNFIIFQWQPDGYVSAYRIVSGNPTSILSNTAYSTAASARTLTATKSGTTITCSVDGTSLGTFPASYLAGTGFGVQQGTSGTVDNVTLTSP